MTMCQMYEFLANLTKRFYSLAYVCKVLQKHIIEMLLNYIDSIDDETFLTQIVLEKDYQGRDALRTAVEHDLLDLIQAPKIEGIIKRIYNSDYEQYGDIYEMSTPYQILYGDKTLITDIESTHRFYK